MGESKPLPAEIAQPNGRARRCAFSKGMTACAAWRSHSADARKDHAAECSGPHTVAVPAETMFSIDRGRHLQVQGSNDGPRPRSGPVRLTPTSGECPQSLNERPSRSDCDFQPLGTGAKCFRSLQIEGGGDREVALNVRHKRVECHKFGSKHDRQLSNAAVAAFPNPHHWERDLSSFPIRIPLQICSLFATASNALVRDSDSLLDLCRKSGSQGLSVLKSNAIIPLPTKGCVKQRCAYDRQRSDQRGPDCHSNVSSKFGAES